MRRFLSWCAASALLAALAAPAPLAVAASEPITVTADQPSAVPAGHNWGFDDFFPRGLTVAQGSTVQFLIEGFHTATLLKAGTSARADTLAAGVVTTDPDDTAKNPNGTQPHLALRLESIAPELPSANCGTPADPCAFDGTSTVSSGVPSSPTAGPFVVTVSAAPGTYLFHCRIHPNMVATLQVVAADSADAQDAAQVSEAAARQVTVDVAEAKVAEAQASHQAATHNPDGTTTWRVQAGGVSANGHVSLFEFLPQNLNVHRGDRVVWSAPDPDEVHTVTFPTDLHTDMVALCEGPSGTDTPATPTVNPPTGPQDFACGTNPADEVEFDGGNGVRRLKSATTVADSGLLSPVAGASNFGVPVGSALTTWSVTLQPDAAKTVYHYVCQIHTGMEATLTLH